jgi:putative transposase
MAHVTWGLVLRFMEWGYDGYMNEEKIYRKRCKRYDVPGHAHFLTFSCFRRQAFLGRDRAREWLAEAIVEAKRKQEFRLIAWVFMPEHVHLLIKPERTEYRISSILASMKLPVTIAAREWVVAHAPTFLRHMLDEQPNGSRAVRFWQRGGGYDRNIYTAEELWEKIRYIHQNPVRRGLVARAVDWRWSSAVDYTQGGVGVLPVDNKYLPWTRV